MTTPERDEKHGFFKKAWVITTVRILSLVFVAGLTVCLFLFRNQVKKLEIYGYPGIFLISILANATIILPVPGVLFTSAMGAVFNPFWVAMAAGAGAAIGEITGYLAGFSGQAIVESRKWYDRFTRWMKKYGDVTILVLAVIPNPIFDIAGMVAGALKLPLWRYLLWCTIGKILKMLIFAYFGAYISTVIPWAF
jgi:uncharacterized membrane protein YdjX (TVP38/TMEM64 family)